MFQKWFDIDVLNLQTRQFWCGYFGIFCLGNCFGNFLKNWAILIQSTDYPAYLCYIAQGSIGMTSADWQASLSPAVSKIFLQKIANVNAA
jgi:hypothetical protein